MAHVGWCVFSFGSPFSLFHTTTTTTNAVPPSGTFGTEKTRRSRTYIEVIRVKIYICCVHRAEHNRPNIKTCSCGRRARTASCASVVLLRRYGLVLLHLAGHVLSKKKEEVCLLVKLYNSGARARALAPVRRVYWPRANFRVSSNKHSKLQICSSTNVQSIVHKMIASAFISYT